MQQLNLIAVGLAFLFLVPGFIIHSIISSVTPRRHDETQLLALRFLTFSAINALICAPILLHIKHSYPAHLYTATNWCLTFVASLIAPSMIGVIIALIEEHNLVRLAFRSVGLSILHQSPSAWDTRFKFLANGNYSYMIVTLAGGRIVYGYFGDVSIASSDTSERDLYLQRVYNYNGVDKWIPVLASGGILIKSDTIESIEIIREVKLCQTKRINKISLRLLLQTPIHILKRLSSHLENLIRLVNPEQELVMGGEQEATARRHSARPLSLLRKRR